MIPPNSHIRTLRHALYALRSTPSALRALHKNLLHFFLAIITIAPGLAQTPDSSLVELPDQRTYFSKTYYNAKDNTYTAHISAGYIHYRAEDGSYRDINTNLKADVSGGYRSDEGLYRVGFGSSTGRTGAYDVEFELARLVQEKFHDPGRAPTPPTKLNWKILSVGYFDRQSKRYQVIENAKSVTPAVTSDQQQATSNIIAYAQVFNGIDVKYTCENARLKEDIVLSQEGRDKLPDPGKYGISRANAFLVFATEFTLTPNNINVFARATAGRISVRQGNAFAFEGDDPIDFEDDDANLHFFFPVDYAWAVSDSASDFAGKISVKRYFYSDRGKHYLLIGVPWSWINSAPQGSLIIDPTLSPPAPASADVYLEGVSNNDSAPQSLDLIVGKFAGANKKRTIIKFNLAGIPTNPVPTILNAQMKLRYYGTSGSTWVDRWVQAHRLIVNWTANQANYDARITSPSYTPWLVDYGKIGPENDNPSLVDANGTFESTVLFWQSETVPTWKSWDLTAATQKWVNGTATNYGVILWATNEATDGKDLRFRSSAYATDNPKLEVTYSTQAKTVYFLKDHLGSIRATVDASTGNAVGWDDYDPWGYTLAGRSYNAWGPTTSGVSKNKFTGKEFDDDSNLNWYNFGARYYDPQIGRWVVRDPLAEKYPSWSPYAYALNNPMGNIDQDGRDVVGIHVGYQLGLFGGGAGSVQIGWDFTQNRLMLLGNRAVGGMFGASATLEFGVVVSPNTISQLEGTGIEYGLDISRGHGIGVAYNPSTEEVENIVYQQGPNGPQLVRARGDRTTGPWSFVLSWSPGLSADVHAFKTKTVDLVKWFKSKFGVKKKKNDEKKNSKEDEPTEKPKPEVKPEEKVSNRQSNNWWDRFDPSKN